MTISNPHNPTHWLEMLSQSEEVFVFLFQYGISVMNVVILCEKVERNKYSNKAFFAFP